MVAWDFVIIVQKDCLKLCLWTSGEDLLMIWIWIHPIDCREDELSHTVFCILVIQPPVGAYKLVLEGRSLAMEEKLSLTSVI